jgi:hypothetical protein
MATLESQRGIYFVRFRFRSSKSELNRAYKRSLKTRDKKEAEAAQRLVELTIHRLLTGQLERPGGVDPGDFIVSGGTLEQPPELGAPIIYPTTSELIDRYLAAKGEQWPTHIITVRRFTLATSGSTSLGLRTSRVTKSPTPK